MHIRAAIIDFDKTLTTADMSDLLAETVGKKAESQQLNQLFQNGKLRGLNGLVQRVNFLTGLSIDQLEAFAEQHDCLRPGAVALFEYFRRHHIVTIIASGSTVPFLEIYQRRLGADYVVGSRPAMNGAIMGSVTEADYSGPDFKVRDCRVILERLHIPAENVVAIGDSMADQGIFEFAACSIAIDPHPGIVAYADHVIAHDLTRALPILDRLSGRAAA
ncbi:MAG TPA: HAD family phosphatase [Candidatus Saccharimonadia bacterium]|nr:HAD family phosphatase [Candidatus Saccharimonadia bacterium]